MIELMEKYQIPEVIAQLMAARGSVWNQQGKNILFAEYFSITRSIFNETFR